MGTENHLAEQRETPERFPSLEEIKAVFEVILHGVSYKELRLQCDERGVCLYEMEVRSEDGERAEYNYQRAKYDYKDPKLNVEGRFSASIHVTMFDSKGEPYHGECVANYLDGEWKYV